jgi:hypothetical protein
MADGSDDERRRKGRKVRSDAGLVKTEIFSPQIKSSPRSQTDE